MRWIASLRAGEVKGPLAKITRPSRFSGSVTSSSTTVTSGCSRIKVVIAFANMSLSTARAPPAGTRLASAAFIIMESSLRISSFRRPTAFSTLAARKELLQTSSAKNSVLCAGLDLPGRISCRMTGMPRRTSCQVASLPARPAPITWTGRLEFINCSIMFSPSQLNYDINRRKPVSCAFILRFF